MIADRIDRRKLVIVIQMLLGVVAVFFASLVTMGTTALESRHSRPQ